MLLLVFVSCLLKVCIFFSGLGFWVISSVMVLFRDKMLRWLGSMFMCLIFYGLWLLVWFVCCVFVVIVRFLKGWLLMVCCLLGC